MAEYQPMFEAAIHVLFPFLLGAAVGLLRIGGIIQSLNTVKERQQESDTRNSTAHDKLFTGLDALRRDVNGSIGELGKGLVEVGTRVETLPCRPQGTRQPADCPPRGG